MTFSNSDEEATEPSKGIGGNNIDYRVAVFAEVDDLGELADLLIQENIATTQTDARVTAQDTPGILRPRMSETAAKQLADRIESAFDVTARCVATNALPSMSIRSFTHHVRCEPNGFTLVDLEGHQQSTLPWETLRLVSIGHLPLEHSTYQLQPPITSIHVAPIPSPDTIEATSIRGPAAWFVFTSPLRAVHIEHHLMNYEYLADRKVGSATTNFRFLAEDVTRLAPQAQLAPASRAYLKREPALHYEFATREEFNAYTLLHWVIADSSRIHD